MTLPDAFASQKEGQLCVVHVSLSSLDGSIALHSGESDDQRRSYGFGCGADHDFVETCLKRADSVVISGETLRAAKSIWETENKPYWFVVSRKMSRLDFGGDELVTSESPIESIVERCRELGFQRLLLLCGGQLSALFYQRHLVNELFLTMAPVVLGSPARVPCFPCDPEHHTYQLKLQGCEDHQGHVFLCYYPDIPN